MDDAPWIEVSLTVTPEQAEAVAEVLGRFTREGVVIERLAEQNNRKEETTYENRVHVFGYFLAGTGMEERRRQIEEALWYLGRIQPLPPAQFRPVADRDWMESWKEHYQPLPVGNKLVVVPAWVENEFPGRIPVRINPGMAFGTGTHPSTRLCLEFLEGLVEPDSLFFDIGCGSGILSISAVKLGADHAVAVDTDPASVRSTIENCRLNGVVDSVDVAQGSVPLILGGHFSDVQAPLVGVNILSSVILNLFDLGLAGLVLSGGSLVLAGILDNQLEGILDKAEENGLHRVETRMEEDWAAALLRKA